MSTHLEDIEQDEVCELSCNLDDMTPEQLGFALERLLEGGALDAYTIPIGMKKSRPGVMFRVICRPQQKGEMVAILFRYTTTLGIRETLCRRFLLHRQITAIETPWGTVRRKDAYGCGISRYKYEYEDLARIARGLGCSIQQVLEQVERFASQTHRQEL